jgi:hypothetical protein
MDTHDRAKKYDTDTFPYGIPFFNLSTKIRFLNSFSRTNTYKIVIHDRLSSCSVQQSTIMAQVSLFEVDVWKIDGKNIPLQLVDDQQP